MPSQGRTLPLTAGIILPDFERIRREHCLAKIGQWQDKHACYIGREKNLFNLRRMAVVHNLHVLAQMPTAPPSTKSRCFLHVRIWDG